ncbi:putative uncharacterized protein [Mycoplasma sp. CAG:472]|jgi:hypothetical protein|nr:putative uncharacterized protein [Mycoplasma sp. CAG:472]
MSSYDNDLFYLCSLIEYIARKTHNTKEYVVNKIGKDFLVKIYNLAEVYHSENIDKVSDEIINECNIENGNYKIDNCKSRVPSYFEIGAVYERLIKQISGSKEDYIDNLIKVLTSWIITKIDNYDSSMYYENPSYIYECYKEGKVL